MTCRHWPQRAEQNVRSIIYGPQLTGLDLLGTSCSATTYGPRLTDHNLRATTDGSQLTELAGPTSTGRSQTIHTNVRRRALPSASPSVGPGVSKTVRKIKTRRTELKCAVQNSSALLAPSPCLAWTTRGDNSASKSARPLSLGRSPSSSAVPAPSTSRKLHLASVQLTYPENTPWHDQTVSTKHGPRNIFRKILRQETCATKHALWKTRQKR